MAIQKWSEEVTLAELGDDPLFSDELGGLLADLDQTPSDVVLNLGAVSFVNSSNVAQLLRLRKQITNIERRLVLCGVNSQVWGVFQVTGLDKIFQFTNNVSTALAALQIEK